MENKIYTKEIDGRPVFKTRNKIVVVKDGMQTINPSEEMVLADGWVEYVPKEPTAEEIDIRNKQSEIESLKTELSSSDYKVIKCMEAYLCGVELPYDVQMLHEERSAKRDRINELESSI